MDGRQTRISILAPRRTDVGRTWSARVPLDPLLAQPNQPHAIAGRASAADQGVRPTMRLCLALAKICALALLQAACAPHATNYPALIVLGIDGMDPGFLEAHWADLPNLDRLRRDGEFQRLATTMPPQSPVAWSTFITGTDPTQHGIYDFVSRNPRTLLPFSSLGETEPARGISIGSYRIPLGSPKVHTFRRGAAFWEKLKQRGIPVTLVKVPMDYPPEADAEAALSGLGVPDMQGTFGTFTFFTDAAAFIDDASASPTESARPVSGGRIVPVRVENRRAVLRVCGPANPFRSDARQTAVEMTVDIDPAQPVARFTLGASASATPNPAASATAFILREGEWSDWVQVEFPLIAGFPSARGMFRVYAQQLAGGFRVYVSPVDIDPSAPEAKISAPSSYSARLARNAGLYYTQGIPEDTSALRQHVLSRAEYLAQSRIASREQLALLKQSVTDFRGGFLFFHFFGVDQDSHMLWRKFDADLLETYRMVDDAIGWVRGHNGNATLVVMSDHGFSTFNRAVNLNTWLLSQGYLKLRRPVSEDAHDLLANADWSHTLAYAMGLNSLYLTGGTGLLAGPRAGGALAGPSHGDPNHGYPNHAGALLTEIAGKLKSFRDPDTGAPVVTSVWEPHSRSEYAPDLVAGYAPGYRCAWDAALGGISRAIVEDNQDEWIGDHCIDPQFVPGVLLVDHKSGLVNPALQDLPAWILARFGVHR
jgi:predicted AlkP superfamily phosphohydrolase/phosphomutase